MRTSSTSREVFLDGLLHHRHLSPLVFSPVSLARQSAAKEEDLYFVQCPKCGQPIELPDNAFGPDRTHPWNVVGCDECDLTFDDDDAEVHREPDARGVL